MNIEVEIGKSAAYNLISLITNDLAEMYEHMDDQEYNDLRRVVATLQAEVGY